MLTVHRCLGWRTNGKKVHDEVRIKPGGTWFAYSGDHYVPVSVTYTDSMCLDCQKAMEELYNKPIDELIGDAREMEQTQKMAKKED